MSLKIDSLDEFKYHRIKVSDSLVTKIIGRESDINNLCDLMTKNDYIVVTGPSGIGKSRLAVAAIEKYLEINRSAKVLCTHSFVENISCLDEILDDNERYIIFIDDANNYSKLIELLNFIDYRNKNNIKVILTIRDYLKSCLNSKNGIYFYDVNSLDNKIIREAIIQNTIINNDDWLDQIVQIANGNIRIAFIAADKALNNEKGFKSLFNQNELLSDFFKTEINKIDDSNELIITASIIAIFRSVYLEQLFYINPILKSTGLSKQSFIKNVNILISKEMVDDYNNVVKISNQCFSDFLVNYSIAERKYISIKNLLLVGFKYYKDKIVNSINTIIKVYYNEDFIKYLKKEVLETCEILKDEVSIKRELETVFASIINDYAIIDFKAGIDDYTDKKDIDWILKLFTNLVMSDYCSIALNEILKLYNKTKTKKEDIVKVISSVFEINSDCLKNGFIYHVKLLEILENNNFYDDNLFELVSNYLKFSFNNSKWESKRELKFYSFNVSDKQANIFKLRELSWRYLFSFDEHKIIDVIIDFTKNYQIDGCVEIVKNDVKMIRSYLDGKGINNIISTILYVKIIDNASKYGFTELLEYDKK